ncbi:MAG: helix-turn-helix domain-containing protein [bacterium]
MAESYTTKQVADILNIDKSTLLRWIRQEKVEDVKHRDGRNWRLWFPEDIERVKRYYEKVHKITLDFFEDENPAKVAR